MTVASSTTLFNTLIGEVVGYIFNALSVIAPVLIGLAILAWGVSVLLGKRPLSR